MRPEDVTDMVADISKISNEFNWKPSTSSGKWLEIYRKKLFIKVVLPKGQITEQWNIKTPVLKVLPHDCSSCYDFRSSH